MKSVQKTIIPPGYDPIQGYNSWAKEIRETVKQVQSPKTDNEKVNEKPQSDAN